MQTDGVEQLAHALTRLPRKTKAVIAASADFLAWPAALLLALTLQRGTVSQALDVSAWLFPLASLCGVGVFTALRMYRAVIRFMSRGSLLASAVGVSAATGLFCAINFAFFAKPISINAFVIFWMLGLLYMVGSRLTAREVLRYRSAAKQRVLIYGAGRTGAHLASSLREGGEYIPIAFIDQDANLQRSTIAGMRVYAPKMLATLIKRYRITSVLLAVPSSSRRQRQEILKSLAHHPVHVRTVPAMSDIMSGKSSVTDVHDVDANDLLGRDPVPPNEELYDACIRGKNVLVTGAGGSIGSELCRQIARLGPTRLLLLEISEASLYQIERELRALVAAQKLEVEVVALLGNAHHRNRMREILLSYDVQTIYHAAAYKHVPIVEYNMVEGIHNNIFSTFYTAEAALECKVETFVLISTDKAVNPTNVMGATKRFAELTLQALQSRSSFTRFCMVRFGNVLESSGSVVPLFREQIKRGEAVTVTHKDIIRYFMTIPEAAQLVLQAGAMAKGGDVFVLNMGDPVRIDDLARRMISLMGRTVRDAEHPDGDIEIIYTGLRPAEKLYEELLIGTNVTPTAHPMIMRAMEHSLSWPEMKQLLDEMLTALDDFDCEVARALLKEAVREYRPDNDIQDLVWQRGQNRPNVTDIRRHRAKALRVEMDMPRINLN